MFYINWYFQFGSWDNILEKIVDMSVNTEMVCHLLVVGSFLVLMTWEMSELGTELWIYMKFGSEWLANQNTTYVRQTPYT